MSMRKRDSGVCSASKIWIIGALIVALLPLVAWAQFDEPGNFTVGGRLGVGTDDPQRGFHLQTPEGIFRIDRDADPASFMMVRTAPGDFNTIWKTYLFGVKASGVNAGEFTIRDMGAVASGPTSTKRLTIANNGFFAFGDVVAAAALHVRSPAAGDILRLDKTDGAEILSVENNGDFNAQGGDLELRKTSATTGGYALNLTSTLLVNTGDAVNGANEEAFLALNPDTAILCSPGDTGILRLVDQDNYAQMYRFNNQSLYIGYNGDYTITATNHGVSDDLILSTTGEQIKFIADSNDDTAQTIAFTWYGSGTATADRVMDLSAGAGDLQIDGALTQNHAFDLAEAYLKSEDGLEAGDVVSIDPEEPNAVVLARASNDRTVVGVISTDPGLVMGGGSFSAEKLGELWGEEVGAQFAKEREAIAKNLTENDSYFKARVSGVSKMKSALAKSGKDAAQAKAECAQEEQELAEAVENAAIKSFCKDNLALVALAGRVPVKVDAAYGAIQVGDLLVASATAGHAMRSENPAPGTVVGKALEGFASGQGSIMMMVLNR